MKHKSVKRHEAFDRTIRLINKTVKYKGVILNNGLNQRITDKFNQRVQHANELINKFKFHSEDQDRLKLAIRGKL